MSSLDMIAEANGVPLRGRLSLYGPRWACLPCGCAWSHACSHARPQSRTHARTHASSHAYSPARPPARTHARMHASSRHHRCRSLRAADAQLLLSRRGTAISGSGSLTRRRPQAQPLSDRVGARPAAPASTSSVADGRSDEADADPAGSAGRPAAPLAPPVPASPAEADGARLYGVEESAGGAGAGVRSPPCGLCAETPQSRTAAARDSGLAERDGGQHEPQSAGAFEHGTAASFGNVTEDDRTASCIG
jgi:hypothetical protein